MTEETATSPVAEADTPAPEVANEPADGEEAPPPEPELEETEYEGKRYRVPKELKDALLRQSDYTRKTQEVSQQRQALEERAKAHEEQAKSFQEYRADYAKLDAIEERLKLFGQVNWQQESQKDPVGTQQLYFQYQQLKDAKLEVSQSIRDKEEKRTLDAQRTRAKQLEERHAVFSREIPDWSPDLANKLTDFAVNTLGIPVQFLQEVTDPAFVKALRLAEIGHRAEKQLTAAANQPRPEVKPVPTVGTGRSAPSNRLHDDLPPLEWQRRRNAQLAKR